MTILGEKIDFQIFQIYIFCQDEKKTLTLVSFGTAGLFRKIPVIILVKAWRSPNFVTSVF